MLNFCTGAFVASDVANFKNFYHEILFDQLFLWVKLGQVALFVRWWRMFERAVVPSVSKHCRRRPVLARHVENGEPTKQEERLYLARRARIRNGSRAKTRTCRSRAVAASPYCGYVMWDFSETWICRIKTCVSAARRKEMSCSRPLLQILFGKFTSCCFSYITARTDKNITSWSSDIPVISMGHDVHHDIR